MPRAAGSADGFRLFPRDDDARVDADRAAGLAVTQARRERASRYFDFPRRFAFSAIRAFTSFRTRATGKGLSA